MATQRQDAGPDRAAEQHGSAGADSRPPIEGELTEEQLKQVQGAGMHMNALGCVTEGAVAT
jgi:hypothetical protein